MPRKKCSHYRSEYQKAKSYRLRHIIIIAVFLMVGITVGATIYFAVTAYNKTVHVSANLPVLQADRASAESSGKVGGSENSSTPSASSSQSTLSPETSGNGSSLASQAESSSLTSSEILAYQSKYPDLYTEKVKQVSAKNGEKTVYLTFDDGPSRLTPKLLNILDQYKIKATFFVVGKIQKKEIPLLKEIVDRGHAIGVHSFTHNYKKIYASPEAFLDDFDAMYNLIYTTTGVKPTIYRFPGGSVNDYDKATNKAIINEMNRRGFVYYDWNVSCGDAEKGTTKASIYYDTISQTKKYQSAIVLMHNTSAKADTLSQLPHIIETLKKGGCHFAKLDSSVKPVQFKLPK